MPAVVVFLQGCVTTQLVCHSKEACLGGLEISHLPTNTGKMLAESIIL